MSTLVYDQLRTGVVFNQKIKIRRGDNIAHVRPWIYKQGVLQDGDFKLTVLDGATELATSIINYQDINEAITAPYFHGFIRFDFASLALRIPEGFTEWEYTFRFEMINYTNDAANYIAIVRNWDDRIYEIYGDDLVGGEPKNDMVEPAGVELYARRHV